MTASFSASHQWLLLVAIACVYPTIAGTSEYFYRLGNDAPVALERWPGGNALQSLLERSLPSSDRAETSSLDWDALHDGFAGIFRQRVAANCD